VRAEEGRQDKIMETGKEPRALRQIQNKDLLASITCWNLVGKMFH
jgi:hypothetical protein